MIQVEAVIPTENLVIRSYINSVPLLSFDEVGIDRLRHIIVPNQLFDGSNYAFPIPSLQHLQIRANKSSKRHEITLENAVDDIPIAICLKMFNGFTPYKIYTTKPNYHGQKQSARKYKGAVELYTYAEIKISPRKQEMQVLLKSSNRRAMTNDYDKYTIENVSLWTRIVTFDGLPAALMETKQKSNQNICTQLTIAPGIDPCLLICLSAICGHLDEVTIRP